MASSILDLAPDHRLSIDVFARGLGEHLLFLQESNDLRELLGTGRLAALNRNVVEHQA